MRPPRARLAALALLLATACSLPGWITRPFVGRDRDAESEATSLMGEELYRPRLPGKFRREQERLLREAQASLEASPRDADRIIWVGRRNAYLGRYQAAVQQYTKGIGDHPEDARLYRHRGHRYLTLRRLEAAVADLERAAQLIQGAEEDPIEPDGLPNAAGVPTTTRATNIWYHLGLAYYVKASLETDETERRAGYEKAARAYASCLEAATHKDTFVAASYWRYLALRRAGQASEAARILEPIRPDMRLLENHAYHRLLLVFAERLRPEDVLNRARQEGGVELATTAYGVAAWYRLTGEEERALDLMREIVRGRQWPAFGHLAAEADLAREAAR